MYGLRRRRSILLAVTLLLTLALLLCEPGKTVIKFLQSDQVGKISMKTLRVSFPDIVDWMVECGNRRIPIIILEPVLLHEVQYWHEISPEAPQGTDGQLFRFGILESDASSIENLLELTHELGWQREGHSYHSVLFTKNGSVLLLFIIRRRRFYSFLDSVKVDGFVDEPSRAFSDLSIKKIAIEDAPGTYLEVPERRDGYLWQLARSRYLECSQSGRDSWSTEHGPLVPVAFVDDLAKLRDLLMDHGMTLLLFGATALGWFRQCGFIEYITEVTLAFPASEWSPKSMDSIQRSDIFQIHQIFGLKHDKPVHMTVRVLSKELRIRMFALHAESNHSWVWGMVVGKMGKRHLYPPLTETCSADLYGHLFHVRCNIMDELQTTYGHTWNQSYVTPDQINA